MPVMKKPKRKIAFKNVCEYCNKEFKTAMPFAKFCCDNHRKYYSNYKKKVEHDIKGFVIEDAKNLMDELREILEKENNKLNLLIKATKKISDATKKMQTNMDFKNNIDCLVKIEIKKRKFIPPLKSNLIYITKKT